MVLAVVLISASAFAQSGTPADDMAVRARLAAYADARNRRDAHAEALCYTQDGDFRSSAGPFVFGREAVEKQLVVADPTYRFLLTVGRLRFVTEDVAVVDADLMTGLGERLAPLLGTYVLVKQDGDWLISAARITRPPAPR
jgi:uncharacterized protein (TIGR02246 family)